MFFKKVRRRNQNKTMTGAVTKTYTTSNKLFVIPEGDFDIIDAIYVSQGTTGRFRLHIGNHGVIDQVGPEQHAKDDKPQLCFLGMYSMNLLCYMYQFLNTSIGKDSEEEVTYTIKGKKYDNSEHLLMYENMTFEYQSLLVKLVHNYPKVNSVKELLNREIVVPVVSCGKLNYLAYKQGCCCLLFCYDE